MSPGSGWRWARAIVNASTASSRVIRLRSAQPTTRREKRSRMPTRYSQPRPVHGSVMSAAPVAAATRRMGGVDVHGELLILASPRRHRTSLRRVEPGATDPEYRAEQVDRKRGLLSRDEGELHPYSLAKKAVAFFRMSRSIRSVLFSRRKCASSARSSRSEERRVGKEGRSGWWS